MFWSTIASITGKSGSLKALAATMALGASASMLGGCNDAQAGLLLGGGLGALTGQAIGGNTGSTLLGLGIGAGAGYIIGNESDKARHHYYGHHDWRHDYYHHHHYHDHCHGNYDY